MRKKLLSLFLVITICLSMPLVQASAADSYLEMSQTSITLAIGEKTTLTAYTHPSKNMTINWYSSDTSIATVSEGKLTAKKEGTVTITAKAKGYQSATCTVKVVKPFLKMSSKTLNLEVGEAKTLTAYTHPAKDMTISWSSSDNTIATVSNGKIAAKKAGTVTITATAKGYKKTTCTVTIKKSTYYNKVNTFINDERFCNGITWSSKQKPKLSSYNCSGCCAYTADFVKFVFNKETPRSGDAFTKASDIRTGDVVYVTDSSHWFVVLERDGNALKTAEGNWGSKVVISSTTYTIKDGKLYRNGKQFRTFSKGYHYK